MQRLLQAITLMVNEPLTAEQLSNKLGRSLKTAYRYIDTFKEAGFVVEKDECNGYKIKRLGQQFKELEDLIYFTREEAYILKAAIESINENTILKQNLKKKLYSIYDFKMVADIVVEPKNRDVIHNIIDAIEQKKQVELLDYNSAHSNSVCNRIVEPFAFTANFVQVWCYVPSDHMVKLFKVARIHGVRILPDAWRFESYHRQDHLDIFRIHGKRLLPIKLMLTVRAASLLMEEYPLSKDFLTRTGSNSWVLETSVCGYEGVTRFILGLYDDIQIIESPELIFFVRKKINSMK